MSGYPSELESRGLEPFLVGEVNAGTGQDRMGVVQSPHTGEGLTREEKINVSL